MTGPYRIDSDNRIQPIETATEASNAAFATMDELAHLVADWPLRRLVSVWNYLPGAPPLSRFENRAVAVQRIWRALHREPHSLAPTPLRPRRTRRTKTQIVLQLLQQPEGATLQQLMKATQWQAHSVRSFLSANVPRQLGLPVVSTKRDSERVYRVADMMPVH